MAIRVFQIRTMTQTSAMAQWRWRVTESVRGRRVTESVTDSESVTQVTLAAASEAGSGE